jgi:hypothetical protein
MRWSSQSPDLNPTENKRTNNIELIKGRNCINSLRMNQQLF